MDDIINAMSNEDLEALKLKYASNASLVKTVDGILEVRANEAKKAQDNVDFAEAIKALIDLPDAPEGIHNVYLAWTETEVPVGEPQAVTVKGVTEMVQQTTKVWNWKVEVNHASTTKANSTGTSKVSGNSPKRAIEVKRIDGNTLTVVGHYANATMACADLKLAIGGDSAMRVLARNNYVVSPWEGELK